MFNQGLNGREKIKFRVNLPKNRRIKGLKTKTEQAFEFKGLINSISYVIEENN